MKISITIRANIRKDIGIIDLEMLRTSTMDVEARTEGVSGKLVATFLDLILFCIIISNYDGNVHMILMFSLVVKVYKTKIFQASF